MFALVNLPEVVKGALFARYSRSPKSLRRLFLDEFVGELDITGDITHRRHRRPAAGRGALRPGVLRVRRRLGGPARRRAPGLRAGVEPAHQGPRVGPADVLPRAVDPLHRLRRPPRRPLPLLPRPRAAQLAARHPLRRRHGPAVRHLRRAAARRCRTTSATQFPKEPGDSDFVYRQAIRAKAFDALRGILPAASLSNVGIYGTGQAYEALLLRMRAHPLPEARAYADLMLQRAAQGHPVVPQAGRPRPTGAWPGATTWPSTRAAMDDVAARLLPPSTPPEPAPRGHASSTSTPTPRSSWSPRCSTRTSHLPETRSSTGCGRMSAEERIAVVRAYVGERANRRHKPGPGARADRLPLRRARRLRRLPRPPAPPHADHRVAAAQPPPRLHPARAGRRSPAPPPPSTRRWTARPPSTTCWPTASRPRRPTPSAWPTGSASCMQLNAREAMHLIELRTEPAGPPRLPAGRPGDAPPHRRAGRPPGRGRDDALRRPHARGRASSASTPSAGPSRAPGVPIRPRALG